MIIVTGTVTATERCVNCTAPLHRLQTPSNSTTGGFSATGAAGVIGAFFGMQAMLVYYMTKQLLFERSDGDRGVGEAAQFVVGHRAPEEVRQPRRQRVHLGARGGGVDAVDQ